MGIGATNRIIDPRRAVGQLVAIHEAEKRKRSRTKSRRNLKHFLQATSKCTKCTRGMSKKIADLQLENKREDAPICIPCILGIARRPLSVVKKDTKLFSPRVKRLIKLRRFN